MPERFKWRGAVGRWRPLTSSGGGLVATPCSPLQMRLGRTPTSPHVRHSAAPTVLMFLVEYHLHLDTLQRRNGCAADHCAAGAAREVLHCPIDVLDSFSKRYNLLLARQARAPALRGERRSRAAIVACRCSVIRLAFTEQPTNVKLL